jgi:hypothetical protein
VNHRYWSALTVLLSALLVTSAHAETRLAVQEFEGPHASSVRSEVARVLALQDGVTVVSRSEIAMLARSLRVDPETVGGRLVLARELQLSAWISGTVKKRSHKYRLVLQFHDGAEHERVGRVSVSSSSEKRLKSKIRDELWDRSRDAVELAMAPLPEGRAPIEDRRIASAETSRDAARESDPVPTAEDGTGTVTTVRSATLAQDDSSMMASAPKPRRDTLRANVGIGSPYRSFAYNDAISDTLGDHTMGGVPMFDLAMTYFPARPFTDGWGSWIGIDAAAQVSLGSTTEDTQGNKYESRYSAYRIGLRGRIPAGRHAVSLFSGYAMSKLGIEPEQADVSSPMPNVDYRMVRTGAGAEFALTNRFSLGLDAAWLQVLSVGELGEWFPRATAGGVEVMLAASYALSQHFFARVTATYQRTFFDFNSQPGDAQVAGGATDQYLTAAVGMGVNL